MMRKNLRILSNSAKFSADRPLLPAATMASTSSTYHLPSRVAYCRLDNARRAAVVAILPGNCHPSSYYYYWKKKKKEVVV